VHFSAPVGQGALRDGDQRTDLAVGEAQAAEGLAQLGTLPPVEVIPLFGTVEEPSGHFRSHCYNVSLGCDTNRRSAGDTVRFRRIAERSSGCSAAW
jgi:hypothetical protein